MGVRNIKPFMACILLLGFGSYAVVFVLTQDLASINYVEALLYLAATISASLLFWVVFVRWLWKCKLFHPWLVTVPNVEGSWEGIVRPNWNRESMDLVPLEITIQQSLFNVKLHVKPLNSKSSEVFASFVHVKGSDQYQLVYSYIYSPKDEVEKERDICFGSAVLNCKGFHATKLDGEYWTTHKTTGEIHLKKVKEHPLAATPASSDQEAASRFESV